MINRLEKLYGNAIYIEANSKSPRIEEMHRNGKHCDVEIGISDPRCTEYLLVSLNPGGNGERDKPQDAAMSAREHHSRWSSFGDYLKGGFPYAHKLTEMVNAFADKINRPFAEVAKTFGAANFSVFRSPQGPSWESFFIEVRESFPVLQQELALPKLKGLIFSGHACRSHFTDLLYVPGSPISHVALSGDKHVGYTFFETTIVGRVKPIRCAFIVHVSGARGITHLSLRTLGQTLATLMHRDF